ncbi:MAG: hypothetical protein CVT63_05610 [Candidatus Anoxymicrobium japonicum]|uniref:Uncharacterized protein n=1 Tax=Candidatus Anoxymicrobium japonicum TaxID=2013648 RepID=A0A2N3G5H9_9ACTN|nr:MAG: hypothetical protein CVT63_05610 [Candidatus Anoxymicrobium japonicum]
MDAVATHHLCLGDVAFLNLEEDLELVLWIESLPPAAALVHACAPFLPRDILPPFLGASSKEANSNNYLKDFVGNVQKQSEENCIWVQG